MRAAFRAVIPLLVLVVVVSQPMTSIPSREAVTRRYTVDTQPIWTVGGTLENPEREFDHRNGLLSATMTRGGMPLVLDADRIHVFEDQRRTHSITGTRGAGPSEFTGLFSACSTHPDTIVTYDIALRRVSILARDGHVVRQFGVPSYRPMLDNAVSVDGTILFHESGSVVQGQPVGGIVVVDTRGVVVAKLGSAPIRTSVVRPQLVGLSGGALIADPMASEIRVVNRLAQTQRTFALDESPEPMDPGDQVVLGPVPRSGSGASPSQAGRSVNAITHWPRFGRVLLDHSDRLWIERFPRQQTEDGEWTIVRLDGSLVGILRSPRRSITHPPAQLIAADSTGVVLLHWDADGAAVIARYRTIEETQRTR